MSLLMKRIMIDVSLIALLAFLVQNANAQDSTKTDEAQLITQLDRDFDAATAEKGVDGWVSYFADNGSMLGQADKPITGHAAIRETMTEMFANPNFSLRWQPTKAEILIPGFMGYTVGKFQRHAVNKAGKKTLLTGTYVSIWKKQPDGAWKIILDTGSPDGPPKVVE